MKTYARLTSGTINPDYDRSQHPSATSKHSSASSMHTLEKTNDLRDDLRADGE